MNEYVEAPEDAPACPAGTEGCPMIRWQHEADRCYVPGRWCSFVYYDGKTRCGYQKANHYSGGPRPRLRHTFQPIGGSR